MTIDRFIPTWLCRELKERDIEPVFSSRMTGGVVADVWKVMDRDGFKHVFRRTENRINDIHIIVKILNKVKDRDIMPLGFEANQDTPYSFVTHYQWIDGEALCDFNIDMASIISIWGEMGKNCEYPSMLSIYRNVCVEATEITKNIRNAYDFSQEDRKYIVDASELIMRELEENQLNRILNNRGFLTHGDLKPANVISGTTGLTIIDWDKVCSLSPEADAVYALFTGKLNYRKQIEIMNQMHEMSMINDVFDLSTRFLPAMYLVHDVFIYLNTRRRFNYICESVLPLVKHWQII